MIRDTHTHCIELWSQDFPLAQNERHFEAKQYDEIVLSRARPLFEEVFSKLVQRTVKSSYTGAITPDIQKAINAAENNVKDLINLINKKVREDGLLDREFDQFGLSALKRIYKEVSGKIREWVDAVPLPDRKATRLVGVPNLDKALEQIAPVLKEFAKLDGYNVWRRSGDNHRYEGKLTTTLEGEQKRVPTQLSWIVPVREWAEFESWGEDPISKQPIAKTTHKDNVVDP